MSASQSTIGGASQPSAGTNTFVSASQSFISGASQPSDRKLIAVENAIAELKEFVKKLGRFPQRRKKPISDAESHEDSLAQKVSKHRRNINDDVWQELKDLELKDLGTDAIQAAENNTIVEELIAEVREFGRFPRRNKAVTPEGKTENSLAQRLREKRLLISDDVWQELEALSITVNPRHTAESAHLLELADEPPDPMAGFADEAESKLEQDLMLFSSGDRTRDLTRRLKKYKDFIAKPSAAHTEFSQKYKQRILTVSEGPTAPGTYVPGDEIYGNDVPSSSACSSSGIKRARRIAVTDA